MAILLIYVRDDTDILDYRFYSRELSPLSMDTRELNIIILKEKHSDHTDIALLKLTLVDYTINETKLNSCVDWLDGNQHTGTGDHANHTLHTNKTRMQLEPVYEVTATKLLPERRATVPLNAHLASCIACEFGRSRRFRRNFIKQVKKSYGFTTVYDPRQWLENREYDCVFDSELWLTGVIEIVPQYPKQKIDYAWCYRLEGQVAKRMILEETMAWLSTLGGGYSSLGDYFQYHAEEAGRISFKQLSVAIEMGDPIFAARCKLFFAQSLMQRGYLAQSRSIVRAQHRFARSLKVKDEKLLAMCKFLRKRLHYLKSLKKFQFNNHHSDKR